MPESDGPGGESCTPDPSVPSRVRWLLRYARMNQKKWEQARSRTASLGYEPWWIPDLPAVKVVEAPGVAPSSRALQARAITGSA